MEGRVFDKYTKTHTINLYLHLFIMPQPILSWMENTPEFQQARVLAQNGGRWEWTFYTTLGHIVTKILDMDIRFTLPDGTEYRPFTTVWEVNSFLGITARHYGQNPNSHQLGHLFGELYRRKVSPKEREILEPRKITMSEFFQSNVWWMLKDSDTIDMLLQEIDALSEMWIGWVDWVVCDDVGDLIVTNCIWIQKWLMDWNRLPQDERDTYTVEFLDKDTYTEYFSHIVVESSWRRNPRNAYRHMDSIQGRLRALYVVDSELQNSAWKGWLGEFRNTRYL